MLANFWKTIEALRSETMFLWLNIHSPFNHFFDHKFVLFEFNRGGGGSERGSEETKLNGAGKGEGIFIFLRNPFAHHFNHTFGFQALLKNTSKNSLVLELSLTLSPSSWMPYHEQSGKQIPLWCSPDLEKLHLFSDWLSFSSLLDSLCTTTFLCKTFSILCITTFLCKTFSIYLLFLLKKKISFSALCIQVNGTMRYSNGYHRIIINGFLEPGNLTQVSISPWTRMMRDALYIVFVYLSAKAEKTENQLCLYSLPVLTAATAHKESWERVREREEL